MNASWDIDGFQYMFSTALTDSIPSKLLRKSHILADAEAELRSRIAARAGTPASLRICADNLRASFAIERDYLRTEELYCALSQRLSREMDDKEPLRRSDRIAGTVLEFLRDSNSALTRKGLLSLHAGIAEPDGRTLWGSFRNCSVCVVSETGKIVYKAPIAVMVVPLMERFFAWWNDKLPSLPPSIGAALAHLFFIKIHPFEDGNGRLSRLLVDRVLSLPFRDATCRTMGLLPYGVSIEIEKTLPQYYSALRNASCDEEGAFQFVSYIQDVQRNAIACSLERLDSGNRESTQ